MSFWKYANPVEFVKLERKIRRFTAPLAIVTLIISLVWGFFFTPDDIKQGSTVKIIYLHVPAALVAIQCWFVMIIASLIWLIRRHHVSALLAKAAAPVGLTMTIAAMTTGALWGKPMWGTYWVWDPRLTSFFVLMLFYFAYIALWSAIEDRELVADMTSIMALIGGVFAFLSRYAVNFWNQGLHQGATLSLDKEENISDVFFFPLLLAMAAFTLIFISLTLYRTETEIFKRRLEVQQARSGADDD